MAIPLRHHFGSSKVPRTITPTFWGLKILTTAMGEATSDYFVNRFDPRAAVVVTAVVFVVVLWWQLRMPAYRTVPYWSAVVMVSVFGTMCADVVHVEFGVPYVVSAITFAARTRGGLLGVVPRRGDAVDPQHRLHAPRTLLLGDGDGRLRPRHRAR